MSDLGISILAAFLIALGIQLVFYFLSKRDFTKFMEKISKRGKETKIIGQKSFQSEPRSQPQLKATSPFGSDKFPYDLSTGTTSVVGEGKMSYGTSEPVIQELFDYGKRKLGEKVIDSILDSVFSDEEYTCPDCGTEVSEDDTVCPECGEIFDEE